MNVASDATTMDIDMCLQYFDKFCGTTKHKMYDEEICNS